MDKKNVLTKVLIAFLALMFMVGVVFGGIQVLSAEGQMPPEEKYQESRTDLPQSKTEIIAYLNACIDFAIAEKASLNVKTEISIEDSSISFEKNGDMLTKSFIYTKESILGEALNQYSSVSVDFGRDFSGELWNLDFNGALIEKTESKEDGDNYTFKIIFPDESNPFGQAESTSFGQAENVIFGRNGIVNESFHMKDSQKVLEYLRGSYNDFAAVDNVKVKCSGLEIDSTVDRLTDKISNITYSKKLNIEADVTFLGELSALGTKKMSFTLQENTGFRFTWASLTLKPPTLKMKKGDIKVISAFITASGDIKAEWSSSNPEVAEVDSDGYIKARKVSPQPVIITAKFDFLGKTYTDTCEVFVTVPVTKVMLSEKKLVLAAGETKTLEASVKPKDATIKDVLWYTNNDAVAVVDNNGHVTGVAKGETEIYILSQDGYYKISCAVTVTD